MPPFPSWPNLGSNSMGVIKDLRVAEATAESSII